MIYLFWVGLGCDEWGGGSIYSELIMCGGGVHSSVLPLVDRCLETIYVCIWRMFVLCML